MKRTLHLLLLCFIFIAPFRVCIPHAVAQSWLWGRKNTGIGVDAWAVATDASGNVFGGGVTMAGGAMTGIVDFGSGVSITLSPYESIWVKYSNSGTPLWAGNTIGIESVLHNMTVDAEGNLIIFGSFSGPTVQIGSFTLTNAYYGAAVTTVPQYYLAKISPSGTVLWAINDGNTSLYSEDVLGTNIMSNGGVTTDAVGNIYITSSFIKPTMTIGGTTLTNTDATGLTSDVFLAKYSPAGVPIWARSFGGSKNDYGYGITVASTGNVYVTGAFYSPSIVVGSSTLTNPPPPGTLGIPLAYIAEYTFTGAPVWGQQGAVDYDGSFGVGLASDNYGNVYMTGGFEDNSISFGDTVITRTYPSTGSILALYLVRFSPSHVATWYKTIGSSSRSLWGYSIALSICGKVWVSGNYSADANIDGHILSLVPGPDPVFIAGYNLAGGVVGYSGVGSGGDDQNGIACDGSGNVFLCSDIFGGASIYLGTDTLTSISASENFYIGKYTDTATFPDTVSASYDPIVCGMDSLTLKGLTGYTYYWDDSSTNDTLTVHASGTYYVYNTACSDYVVVDTFHVNFLPSDTALFAASDLSSCLVGGFTLSGPIGYSIYSWSTGNTTASITVTDTGSFVVYAISSTGCHTLSDTFHVSYLIPDTLYHHQDTVVCTEADDAYININLAPPTGRSYSWFDGSSGNTDSVRLFTSGKFWVSYITGCNYNLDTFAVTVVTPCDSGHTAGIAVPSSERDVNLYPNPVADILTITTGQINYSSCTIVNVLGQALIRQPLMTPSPSVGAMLGAWPQSLKTGGELTKTNVDVTTLPAGVYYLVLYNDNDITVRKFVKE